MLIYPPSLILNQVHANPLILSSYTVLYALIMYPNSMHCQSPIYQIHQMSIILSSNSNPQNPPLSIQEAPNPINLLMPPHLILITITFNSLSNTIITLSPFIIPSLMAYYYHHHLLIVSSCLFIPLSLAIITTIIIIVFNYYYYYYSC